MPGYPVVIPYGGPPAASLRMLDLQLIRSPWAWTYKPLGQSQPVTVGIDGLSYIRSWGRHLFEIPADRHVNLSVHIVSNTQAGTAWLVLSPHEPAVLDYSAPANINFSGSIGPRGTTSAKGAGLQGCLLAGLVIALGLLIVVPLIVVVALATG